MKYLKVKSLTWWVSVAPIIAGLIIASEPLHGASSIVQTINSATGDISPAVLINSGLIGIGLRGAI